MAPDFLTSYIFGTRYPKMLFRLLICRCSLVVWYEKFKSVSDWQDVDALMCSVFIYLGLHYRLYICIL